MQYNKGVMNKKIIILLLILFIGTSCFAGQTGLISKFKKIFYYRTTKSRPLQVKVIPKGASCNPDISKPEDCNVKK